MSIPADYISDLLNELSQGRLGNLITQADARRILQEVKEIPENYPDFDPLLTEKATHIAYVLLSCGCSLMEESNSNFTTTESLSILERAGKLLSDVYKYNDDEFDSKDYNLLISGMALYAAKQYSRAFIVLNKVNLDFIVGQIVSLILLVLIGLNMIRETIRETDKEESASLSVKVMLPAAVATSIDAFAVGVTFAALEVNIIIAVLLIGFIAFLFSCIGVKIGSIFGSRFEKQSGILGGIILILIGIKIFVVGH